MDLESLTIAFKPSKRRQHAKHVLDTGGQSEKLRVSRWRDALTANSYLLSRLADCIENSRHLVLCRSLRGSRGWTSALLCVTGGAGMEIANSHRYQL